MDRKGQLRNVAFGGAWSEQIAGDEALKLAMCEAERAVDLTEDEDLRGNLNLMDAVGRLAVAHPKGAELARSWHKALAQSDGYSRRQELQRLAHLFRAGLGERLMP